MKKVVLILIPIFIFISAFMLYRAFNGSPMPEEEGYTTFDFDNPDMQIPRPGGPSADGQAPTTVEIRNRADETVTVNNFLNNGETVADVVNPGRYVLAGDLNYKLADGTELSGYESDQFFISYSTSSQTFHVTLQSEPIAEARREAEQFLLDRLGVSEEELCGLRYSVITPFYVNMFYAGEELGFSFCPGGVSL